MASAGDIRAGGAWLDISAKTDKLKVALASADNQLRDFGNKARSFSLETAAAIGAGFFAAKAAVAGAMSTLLSYGDQFEKMSHRNGIGVEALSEFNYMAGQCGTTIETFEAAIRNLQKTQYDAANGSGELVRAYSELGISLTALREMKPEDQFKEVARAIIAIDDPVAKTATAMKIFGESGTQLMPMLNSGESGMDALAEAARDLGLVVDTETAAAAAECGDRLSDLKQSFFGLARSVLVESVPSLTKFATQLTESVKKVIAFVREHKSLVTGVLASSTAFLGLSGVIIGAAKAFTMLSAAATVLSLNPVTLGLIAASAAAAGVYAAFKKASGSADALSASSENLSNKNKELRQTHKDYFAKLEEIAGKQHKTNDELSKAAFYAQILNKAYDGLGITVDETTGKIEGLSGAFAKMNEAQRAQKIADVNAEILEKERYIADLEEKKDAIRDWVGTRYAFKDHKTAKDDEEFLASNEFARAQVERGEIVRDEKTGRYIKPNSNDLPKWHEYTKEINAAKEQINTRRDVIGNIKKGVDIDEAKADAAGAASGSGATGPASKDRIDEYNRQFDQRNFTNHEKKLAEINKRFDALVSERVKELTADGMTAADAQKIAEEEEGIKTARTNRDTLLAEENDSYEKSKKEGVAAEVEKYNQQFDERNLSEHEQKLAEINNEYSALEKKRKAELIKTEGLSEDEATKRLDSDETITTARKNRDTLLAEENAAYEKEASEKAAEAQRAADERKKNAEALKQTDAEKRRDELNLIETNLQSALQKAIGTGDSQSIVGIVDALGAVGQERETVENAIALEQLGKATERFNSATTSLAEAEKSGNEYLIEAARQEKADAASELDSARGAAAGLAEDLRTSIEQARSDEVALMAEETDEGMRTAETKFASVGTFSAYESSKLEASYDKKIADYNLEQLRLQRDMKQILQNQNNSTAAVFA